MISPPSPSAKTQIMGGKVCLRCKGKTLLGIVNKLFVFKRLLTTSSNVLPLHLKQTFPLVIWIFTEGEGDGIESRLPFKIFSTLLINLYLIFSRFYKYHRQWYVWMSCLWRANNERTSWEASTNEPVERMLQTLCNRNEICRYSCNKNT